jgi:NAD(P) transhydrogenase subunit alpha
MKIAVTKETRHHEKRVSIVPEVAKRLIALGTKVVVETGAGECAGFSDEAYRTNGATIQCHDSGLF